MLLLDFLTKKYTGWKLKNSYMSPNNPNIKPKTELINWIGSLKFDSILIQFDQLVQFISVQILSVVQLIGFVHYGTEPNQTNWYFRQGSNAWNSMDAVIFNEM